MNGDAEQSVHRASFEVAVRWGENGSVRLVLAGELDVSTAAQLHTRLEQVIGRGRGDVHLDLAGLRFCAAAGVTELLRARAALRVSGRRLVLSAVPEQVARAIRLADGDALLDD